MSRQKNIRRIAAVLLCLCAAAPLAGCAGKPGAAAGVSAGKKVAVSVSFNAMAELTKAVGGDKVTVSTIIPDGTEPHDFEPKAKDLTAMGGAAVFVYNGLEMEGWAQQAVQAVENPKLVVVEASKGAAAVRDPGVDPHLWLSVKGAELEAKNIRDGLIQADPADKAAFEGNYAQFNGQLEKLYAQYQPVFAAAKSKDFVAGHAAFAYFCRDFGLKQQSVEDVYAEGEPSPKKLAQLVAYCRENHVKTIFAEQLASPTVSKTLADEVGARVETIYTMESSEDGKSFLARMEANLSEIAAALK